VRADVKGLTQLEFKENKQENRSTHLVGHDASTADVGGDSSGVLYGPIIASIQMIAVRLSGFPPSPSGRDDENSLDDVSGTGFSLGTDK
jgi:hypothetical protein